MAAHLSHKIRWEFLADYYTTHVVPGITMPVGDCGLIHAIKKKHKIQVDMRNYITEDMLCKSEDCEITGEKTIYKSERRAPFGRAPRDESKLKTFADSFYKTVHEFATTELESAEKRVELKYEDTLKDVTLSLTFCDACNEFIHCLEFSYKRRLLSYSESELKNILTCLHGGQAVGNSIRYILCRVLTFYLNSNLIMYMDLKEDQWPDHMQPNSYHRQQLKQACDGQTFLPHSRDLLDKAMIDANVTRLLSKRLFRFIYFYVMVRLKMDSNYKFQDDFDYGYFRC